MGKYDVGPVIDLIGDDSVVDTFQQDGKTYAITAKGWIWELEFYEEQSRTALHRKCLASSIQPGDFLKGKGE